MNKFIVRIFSPIRYFINDSRAVGILLIITTIVSIALANSFFGESYRGFWTQKIHGLAAFHLPVNCMEWINNFLMGVFFLMAGTEIKRE
ncbi:MAG: Na+/H+ antiporter NhaA, partial [Ferruginibacter sp.]